LRLYGRFFSCPEGVRKYVGVVEFG
jgi:hypothetical protein